MNLKINSSLQVKNPRGWDKESMPSLGKNNYSEKVNVYWIWILVFNWKRFWISGARHEVT